MWSLWNSLFWLLLAKFIIMCFCFSFVLRTFSSYESLSFAGECIFRALYISHSWPLSRNISLACRIYCVIRNSIWSRGTPDIHTCCRAFSSGGVTTCFTNVVLSRPGFETKHPTCEASAQIYVPCNCGCSFEVNKRFLTPSNTEGDQ